VQIDITTNFGKDTGKYINRESVSRSSAAIAEAASS
jgi:hypothetical protein